jgi:hypothetical protein
MPLVGLHRTKCCQLRIRFCGYAMRLMANRKLALPTSLPYAIFIRFTLINSSHIFEAWLHPQVPNRP